MDAAVRRGGPGDEPWNPDEAISPALALASSTDGQGTLAVGSRGDVVLLDADPLGRPGAVGVAATLLAGRPTYLDV